MYELPDKEIKITVSKLDDPKEYRKIAKWNQENDAWRKWKYQQRDRK